MITAIPTLEGKIAPESDNATEFTLVEGSGSELSMRTVTVQTGMTPPALASSLQTEGALRFLAAEMSPDLMTACEMAGIQVFYGASGTISDALNLISLGILDSMAMGSCGCGGGGCGGGSCGTETGESCACGSENSEKAETGSCGSGCACNR